MDQHMGKILTDDNLDERLGHPSLIKIKTSYVVVNN